MRLLAAARIDLAEQLLDSVVDSQEIDTMWVAEARRRREETRAGTIKVIPGEQVMAEVRRIVER
jgi:putative addiction module component (TIGR02574 family)